MSIQLNGIKAYNAALENFSQAEQKIRATAGAPRQTENEFAEVLSSSMKKVNELQGQRTELVTSFTAGENHNVHELMIAMQKAGIAMNMTAAVRNKVLEGYKELSRLQF